MPTYSITTRVLNNQIKPRVRIYYSKIETGDKPKQKYEDLPILVPKSHWNKNLRRVKGKNPKAEEYNLLIEKAIKAKKSGKRVSYKNEQKSVIVFAEKLAKSKRKHNTRRGHLVALDKLKGFLKATKRIDLEFTEVDSFLANNYYNYLDERYSTSTVNQYFRNFKYFIKEAVKQRIHKFDYDPFDNTKLSIRDKNIDVLTTQELELFQAKDYSHDLNKNYAKSAFNFMMYSAGMRISDFTSLKWKDFILENGKILLKVQNVKTEHNFRTLLGVRALDALRPFITTYEGISFEDYDKQYQYIQETKKKVSEWKKEFYRIQNSGFLEVFPKLIDTLPDADFLPKDFAVEHMYDWTHDEIIQKVKQQQMLEKNRELLKNKIQQTIKWLANENNLLILEHIKILQKLQSNYPDDRVFPRARQYRDEDFDTQKRNALANNMSYHLSVIQEELEIKNKIRPHQARHVFAQKMFEGGASFHDISMVLGHRSLEATENYRKQIITEKSRKLTLQFENILHPEDVSANFTDDKVIFDKDGTVYRKIDDNIFKDL